jgi:hypothetical protein
VRTFSTSPGQLVLVLVVVLVLEFSGRSAALLTFSVHPSFLRAQPLLPALFRVTEDDDEDEDENDQQTGISGRAKRKHSPF